MQVEAAWPWSANVIGGGVVQRAGMKGERGREIFLVQGPRIRAQIGSNAPARRLTCPIDSGPVSLHVPVHVLSSTVNILSCLDPAQS
jgi:hypothetical protein